MMKASPFLGATLSSLAFCAVFWGLSDVRTALAAQPALSAGPQVVEPIQALPPPPKLDPSRVALGERLFREPRISKDNSLSCNSCHRLDRGGADSQPHSRRMGGGMTALNTPTIFNVSLNFQLFWDGRRKTLAEQIEAPRDTQTEWPEVLAKLRGDSSYQAAFAHAYPVEGMTVRTLKDAIVTFERSLLTPARFDRYLLGDTSALSDAEKDGYRLFKRYGCASCHQGANVGGNMYQKLGIMRDYFSSRPSLAESALGRYNVTKRPEDKHVFRVPSLRNVAITAPYLHDGSARTLPEAISIMAQYQLGRPIPARDTQLIIAFLQTLTGEYRGKQLSGN